MQYHNPIPIQTMALAMRQEKENYTIGVSGYTDAGGQDNGIVGMETLHCKNVVDRVSEGSIVVVNSMGATFCGIKVLIQYRRSS